MSNSCAVKNVPFPSVKTSCLIITNPPCKTSRAVDWSNLSLTLRSSTGSIVTFVGLSGSAVFPKAFNVSSEGVALGLSIALKLNTLTS